ncbi:MAG: hypothetical protein WDZ77_00920 [Candidatus Pacearchaeota archaeon]
MKDSEVIAKIMEKKEFSQLPIKDVVMVLEKLEKKNLLDEEKIKSARKILRKIYSGFGGKKILTWRGKNPNEVLEKHLSTKERYGNYEEIYSRILKNLPREISVIDLGCGVNGFSYEFFKKVGKKAKYVGIEAIGQLVGSTNEFFKDNKISGKIHHTSLMDTSDVKNIIKKSKRPRVIFLFKVIDSLEYFERDFTKKLLEEIVPLSERVVLSFATESWLKRKKFFANRKWLIEFISEKWAFIDDFKVSGERYLVFQKD